MNTSNLTIQQIERALHKIAQQFPTTNEPSIITDVHLFVSQESGDLIAYDDNDREITRCVVEEWIDNKDEKFYLEIDRSIGNMRVITGKAICTGSTGATKGRGV